MLVLIAIKKSAPACKRRSGTARMLMGRMELVDLHPPIEVAEEAERGPTGWGQRRTGGWKAV